MKQIFFATALLFSLNALAEDVKPAAPVAPAAPAASAEHGDECKHDGKECKHEKCDHPGKNCPHHKKAKK